MSRILPDPTIPVQQSGTWTVQTETEQSVSNFGDSITVELEQIVSLKASYGILDECETFTASGGSATASNSEFVCQTGTSSGGYGVLWSRVPTVYIPGLGMEARTSARFTTPVASSLQAVGFFTSGDGMFFGYNGTSFGVMHRYNGSIEVRRLTVGTASDSSATVTVTLNGVAYTANVTSGTKAHNAHEITAGLLAGAAASLWNIQHIGETVIFAYKGAGPKSGTYSVATSAGTLVGTIAQVEAGIDPTEDWTAQASWSEDTCSWLDPTKGNIFKFEASYLGFGSLKFSVYNPSTRKWLVVHIIDWANENTSPNFGNPALRVGWIASSLGSTTNLTVCGASATTFIQGNGSRRRTFGQAGTQSGVTTAQQVLSIEVRREFNGIASNTVVVPKSLSITTDSAKGANFILLRNPTLTGETQHEYVDQTQSCVIYDSASTSLTAVGGRNLGAYSIGPSGRATINLPTDDILVSGDQLVIVGSIISGAASELTAALVWVEIT